MRFKDSHIAVQCSFHVVALVTRVTVIIGDVLVLLVTWSKSLQSYRESRRLGIKAPLATLLFCDGEQELIIEIPFYELNHVFRNVLLCVSLLHPRIKFISSEASFQHPSYNERPSSRLEKYREFTMRQMPASQ